MTAGIDLNTTTLRVEIWDDDFGKDDFIGEVRIRGTDLEALTPAPATSALPLEEKERALGTITISRVWLPHVWVRVQSAMGLKKTDLMGKNDVYCKVFLRKN